MNGRHFSSLIAVEGRFVRRNVCDSVTDDVNQCLHNESSSHGFQNANLFNFTFLLVNFGKVLCSSANELQQETKMLLLEKTIFHKYWLFC